MSTTRLLISMLLMLSCMAAQAGPLATFSDDKIKTSVGDTVTVDIVITGFPATEGGGLTLRFDPTIVQVIDVDANDLEWSFATRDGLIDNATGYVKDILFSSYAGVSGRAVVASVTLMGLAAGRSELELIESPLNPFASNGAPLDVSLGSGVIRVSGGQSRTAAD